MPGERTANDLVLLALNGRDDVAHATGASTTERREQRAGSPEGEAAVDETLFGGGAHFALGQVELAVGVGEVLVFDARDLVRTNGDVATSREAERLDAGCTIEGFGDGSAPVDDQWIEASSETARRPT